MGSIVKRGTKHAPKFYAQYIDADEVRRTKLLRGATSTDHARTMLAQIERNVMNGQLGIEEPTDVELERRKLTVRQLGEKFLTGYTNPKIKDLERYRDAARWMLGSRINPRLGDRQVAALGVTDLERFRDELLAPPDPLMPASVTRALALLSKMFAWGRKAGLVVGESPTRGCVRPQSVSSIDYQSREEVRALVALAEEHAVSLCAGPDAHLRFAMVATAVFTGLRKGELFGLRLIDLHLDVGRIDVNRSYEGAPKSGKPRHVPVHPELARILRGWTEAQKAQPNAGGLLFPVTAWGRPRMGSESDMLGLADLLRAARCHVPDAPWHALRHTFASHFMMAGGNILTLQKLLGHSTLSMTMIYAHLSPDHMAAEVARMSFAQPVAGVVADLGEERRRRAAAGGEDPYVEGTSADPGLPSSADSPGSRAASVTDGKRDRA